MGNFNNNSRQNQSKSVALLENEFNRPSYNQKQIINNKQVHLEWMCRCQKAQERILRTTKLHGALSKINI